MAAAQLATATDAPTLEAEVLLAHVLGRERSFLYTRPEHMPSTAQIAEFQSLIEQRRQGQPISYLTGEREFWSLPLKVGPATLIPRPETEHLVEIALRLDLPCDARIADLGTGCGAVALALASERPDWDILASDRSDAALAVARANAARLGLEHIQFVHSDWFGALGPHAPFDLVVANPPYVAVGDPHLDWGDLRFEPRQALISGTDGLDDIRRITSTAPGYLKAGGWLWLEHASQQTDQIAHLLQGAGFDRQEPQRDLAGQERQSGGRLPGPSARPARNNPP